MVGPYYTVIVGTQPGVYREWYLYLAGCFTRLRTDDPPGPKWARKSSEFLERSTKSTRRMRKRGRRSIGLCTRVRCERCGETQDQTRRHRPILRVYHVWHAKGLGGNTARKDTMGTKSNGLNPQFAPLRDYEVMSAGNAPLAPHILISCRRRTRARRVSLRGRVVSPWVASRKTATRVSIRSRVRRRNTSTTRSPLLLHRPGLCARLPEGGATSSDGRGASTDQ